MTKTLTRAGTLSDLRGQRWRRTNPEKVWNYLQAEPWHCSVMDANGKFEPTKLAAILNGHSRNRLNICDFNVLTGLVSEAAYDLRRIPIIFRFCT